MKAGIFFTGTGPIIILTSYDSLTNPLFIEKLAAKGFRKFIAFEVSEGQAKSKYGHHFNVVMGDLHQDDDFRVLDYDGHRILNNFSLRELGPPIFHEP